MTIEETLNEFQKNRVKERVKLDFYKELKKSENSFERKKFSKNFKTQLDIFINQMHNDGVMFYGFSIKRFNFETESEDSINNMWYYTHLKVEDLINYLKEKIELIEFCYISIEIDDIKENSYSKIKRPNFYGVLGVRSLIGYNITHYSEMIKILDDHIDDVEIINLNSIKLIKDYWNFVIKQNNFFFHRFTYYSNFYEEFYGIISDLELQYDSVEHIAFGLDENFDSKFNHIKGIGDMNPDEQTIINYLITIYMFEEKLFLYENNLYKKMPKLEPKLFDSIEYLRENNINIFENLKEKFPQQLKGLKISKLFNLGWNKFFEDIKINNHYLPHFNLLKAPSLKKRLSNDTE